MNQADVITAVSAAEAIEEIERRKPDVLVGDLGTPEQDSYELKNVRERESADHAARVPALALTAYDKAAGRVRVLAGDYPGHLSKPVEPADCTCGCKPCRQSTEQLTGHLAPPAYD